MTNASNILITGLPRSGTTMTCHLLNKLANNVALHEPMNVSKLVKMKPEEIVAEIQHFFLDQREMVIRCGRATSKSWKGMVPTNPRADPDNVGKRNSLIDGMEIDVRNLTEAEFNVYIKHPAFFTAALPIVVQHFSCFATTRNPLSVILSWRSSGMAVANGRMPAAENFDPELAAALDAERSQLSRQFVLIDYCFSQYRKYLCGRTVRYEDIIASSGKALSAINTQAALLNEPLNTRNHLGLSSDPEAAIIAKSLIRRDSECWHFYDREEVKQLIRGQ